ncbi:MAG: alanine racemase, partial [Calditrichia bacterium]|nr:alanine racemase [Calditrichia bacterium]
MISKEELQNNVQEIEANIDKALKKACKSRNDLTLVAVTKIHPVELLKMALETGLTVLGESKVQEALNKQEEIGQSAEWHLIGHLQTNKVKHAVGKFSIIHSVDSLKLANEIQKQCKKKEIIQNILIQVNISKEDSKFGNTPEETIALMKE